MRPSAWLVGLAALLVVALGIVLMRQDGAFGPLGASSCG